ncbi:MAG: hypothetical protein HOP08_18090 [Cyclobacteriaceae bacterium]|nr:hypothetical protein [Cyclobacteriaceae bacterium]
MKYYFLISWFAFATVGHGQSVNTLMGARSAGMGYSSATHKDDAALFNNVGALAEIKNTSVFFAYDMQPGLLGANRMAAAFSLPFKFGTAGIGIFKFGDKIYSEQILSAGFSNKFGIASLGIKANYIQYNASGFGIKNAVSINFGGIAQITKQILVGAYIVNINQSRISEDEQLPTKLVAGIGLKPADAFFISTEIEKDLDYDARWKLGAEYTIHKKIFVRTGFNLNPSAGYFGIGSKARRLVIDYALSFSRIPGSTHQLSVAYRIETSNKK